MAGVIIFDDSDSSWSLLKKTCRVPKLIEMSLVDMKSEPRMHSSDSKLMIKNFQSMVLPLTVMGASIAPKTSKLFPWTSEI
jgi:hypothetical protein